MISKIVKNNGFNVWLLSFPQCNLLHRVSPLFVMFSYYITVFFWYRIKNGHIIDLVNLHENNIIFVLRTDCKYGKMLH